MELISSNLDIIFRSANLQFQEVVMNTPTWYKRIATDTPVTGRSVTYGWLDRLPVMRKWLGNREITAANGLSRTVSFDYYEQTCALQKEDVLDDNLGLFNNIVRAQAQQAAKWPDVLFAQFLATANTVTGYDGVSVYATNHPLLNGVAGTPSGVTQSNLFVSTDLTYANYAAVRVAMMSWNGSDGQPLGIVPNLLVVPPQLEAQAKLVLESDFLAQFASSTTSNAPTTNVYKGTAQILVVPQLANKPNNWWLMDTSQVIMPFIWNLRENIEFTQLINPTDPNVFMSRQFLYGIAGRAAPSESVWFLSAAATSAAAY